MFNLKKMFRDQNLDLFLDKNFTRLPFSIPRGSQDFTSYLTWPVVEEIFKAQKSILRIVKDGAMVKDHIDLGYQEALTYYQQGHTLLLKNAERSHSLLRELADDFSKSFHTEVDIQLYCTPENHNAFGWHYDIEEVFILQTKGSKLYSIRQNTVHPYPLVSSISKDFGYEKETSELEIKVLLKEGDWLYIPSGWWHIARTQSESMHISIGLMPRSAVDVANFLPQYLSHHSFWRTRMPVHKKFHDEKEEVSFYQDAMKTLGKDLENTISDPDFIKKLLTHLKK